MRRLAGYLTDIACLAVICACAWLFLLRQPAMLADLNHNVSNIWLFNGALTHSAQDHLPVQAAVEKITKEWHDVPGYSNLGISEWYVYGVPLCQGWITLARKALGASVRGVVLASSAIGFLAVIICYFLGRALYSRMAGAFAAMFMASSLIFLITVRCGYAFYSFDALLSGIFFLLFYAAHARRSRVLLYFSAIAFGTAWSNGTTMLIIFIPACVAAFIAARLIFAKGEGLFRWFHYPAGMLVAAAMCLAITAGYSMALGMQPFHTFGFIHERIFWRGGTIFSPLARIIALWENIERGFLILFYKSFLPPSPFNSADNVAAYGKPGIAFIASIFAFYWAIRSAKKSSLASTLLAASLSAIFFLWLFILPTDVRYLMGALPLVYLCAGQGIAEFLARLKKRSLALFLVAAAGVAAATAGSIADSYAYYFHEYKQNDGYLGRFYGRVQAAQAVASRFSPADTAVVLNDRVSTPYDIFSFGTGNLPYKVFFLDELPRPLGEWERGILSRYRRIVYVCAEGNDFLSMPGYRYTEPVDNTPIRTLHPGLPPTAVIRTTRGWPVISVYEVTSPGQAYPDRVREYRFTPEYHSPAALDEMYAHTNIGICQEDQRCIEVKDGGKGEAVYKFTRPNAQWESVKVEMRPRMFNDRTRRNRVQLWYSLDGKQYRLVREQRSSGSGKWDYYFHRDSYDTIPLQGDTFYLKFVLEGNAKEVQLWSPPPVEPLGYHYSMVITGLFRPAGKEPR